MHPEPLIIIAALILGGLALGVLVARIRAGRERERDFDFEWPIPCTPYEEMNQMDAGILVRESDRAKVNRNDSHLCDEHEEGVW